MNKESTAVWNRAALEEGGPGRLQSDSALDALYARHIPSDSTIIDAFERRFAGQRTLFAPVST